MSKNWSIFIFYHPDVDDSHKKIYKDIKKTHIIVNTIRSKYKNSMTLAGGGGGIRGPPL